MVFDAYVPAPYAPHRAPPLQPLTLTLSPHQHVAVVGRSGAGKSTFVAALARLLPLGSGRMSIDGWDASTDLQFDVYDKDHWTKDQRIRTRIRTRTRNST